MTYNTTKSNKGEGVGGIMIRVGKKYSLDEVFSKLPDFIKEGQWDIRLKEKADFDGDKIKVTSQRLQTFYIKGTKCVCCGLEGSYFVKEKSVPHENYHFNLYGVNDKGEEVLFTKDHIVPKSKGGLNRLENYQTMCTICNENKGNLIEGE